MLDREFSEAIKALAIELGLEESEVLETIREAFITSYKARFDKENLEVEIIPEERRLKFYLRKKVVDKVVDSLEEILLNNAEKIKRGVKIGDIVNVEMGSDEIANLFGRTGIQKCFKIMRKMLKESELDNIYNEYLKLRGEIISGVLERGRKLRRSSEEEETLIVNLEKVEGRLPPEEQLPRDKRRVGDKLRFYVKDVIKERRKVVLILSRREPEFVEKLFEQEVPEIEEGIIEILGIVREPGDRTKLLVRSTRENLDPVGFCVGVRGVRIQAVTRELDGEKIDVIKYSDKIPELIRNAISPSDVSKLYLNSAEKMAIAIVPDDQISSAIGKEGQNVRLASELIGWNIEVKGEKEFEELLQTNPEYKKKIEELYKPEEQIEKEEEKKVEEIQKKIQAVKKPVVESEEEEADIGIEETSIDQLPDVPEHLLKKLKDAGFDTIESIVDMSEEELMQIPGIGKKGAEIRKKSLEENVMVIEE